MFLTDMLGRCKKLERRAYKAEMKKVTIMFNAENKTVMLPSGAEMYYAKFGRGSRQMVMIPGLNIVDMSGTAGNLAYFYRRFAKELTVYVFDRRKGRDPGCTIRTMAEDLAGAMMALNITDAYVVGVSQGGMIAQYLAAYHPELVRRLVLGVTAAKTNPLMISAVDEWLAIAENGDLQGVLTKSYDKMYTEKQMKLYRRLIPLMMRFTKFMSIERFADHARAIYSLDCSGLLDRIKCPVLVLGAELDKITTAEGAKEIADKLGCKVHIFPNEGHAVYLGKGFNRMVYDFFEE
ncbi:Pimeloyl-ACP methyl ester carboxylesterase [Ruminococcus sp. YRD2003]|nr:Pimeloyl-ACP methyl ester carboxylesterase [Ruminococcus flavefaciens]